MKQIFFIIQLVAATYMLWLGLYMFTRIDLLRRDDKKKTDYHSAWFIAAACVMTSVYLLGVAMETMVQSKEEFLLWQRLTWWTSMYGLAFFLLTVIYLDYDRSDHRGVLVRRIILIAVLTISTLMAAGILLGIFTDTSHIRTIEKPFKAYYTPHLDPQYTIFSLWTLFILSATVFLLLHRYWNVRRKRSAPEDDAKMERSEAASLAMAGVLIFTGTMIGVWGVPGIPGAIPRQLGMVGIAAGGAMIGIAITRAQAFLHSRTIAWDFRRSLLSTTIVLTLYLGIFCTALIVLRYPIQPVAIALIAFLVVLPRAPLRWEERLTDRVLLPHWLIGYRKRLMTISDDALTALTPRKALTSAEPELSQAVHDAYREELYESIQRGVETIFQYKRFKDDAILAHSNLQRLAVVERYWRELGNGASPSDGDALAANALRKALITIIGQGIDDHAAREDMSPEAIGLVVIRKQYIEERTRAAVESYLLNRYGVALRGGAYSRSLKLGRNYVTNALFEAEVSVQGLN